MTPQAPYPFLAQVLLLAGADACGGESSAMEWIIPIESQPQCCRCR
jgi:hypothetical protein